MNIPFSIQQFLQVFEQYNLAVWPMQVVFNVMAAAAIIMAQGRTRHSNKAVAGILSFLWLWMGIAYHLIFFSAINKAAFIFAVAYIVQSTLFLYAGVIRSDLSFHCRVNGRGVLGSLFILYALILYPVLGYFLGHVYPKSPTFGLPCPTTIFTFGILLWADVRVPGYLLVVPFLWSIIGFSAALMLGIREDIGLLFAGTIGTLILFTRRLDRPKTI
jgi:hypothetical protein